MDMAHIILDNAGLIPNPIKSTATYFTGKTVDNEMKYPYIKP